MEGFFVRLHGGLYYRECMMGDRVDGRKREGD